jgi:hypothetical protein
VYRLRPPRPLDRPLSPSHDRDLPALEPNRARRHPGRRDLPTVWALTVDGQLVAIGETPDAAERLIFSVAPPNWVPYEQGLRCTDAGGRVYRIERWAVLTANTRLP